MTTTLNNTETIPFRTCRTSLRRVCPEAAALTDAIIYQVLFSAASKGNVKTLLLMLNDISQGRTPIEARGGVRPFGETLPYERFLEIWEEAYLGSSEQTRGVMNRLKPLLRSQLGLVEVVVK